MTTARAADQARTTAAAPAAWSVADGERLYGLDRWGMGYFRVSPSGNVRVHPDGAADGPSFDLHEIVAGLSDRGLSTPLLLRFTDILDHRLRSIRDAFAEAIAEEGYTAGFRGIYPIKVNQQRQVVQELRDFGGPLGFGLEAGSKPELLAVLGVTASRPEFASTPIVCNGFKDAEYIETVVLATKIGRDVIPIVEHPRELELILDLSDRHGVEPRFGVRIKPSAQVSGRWQESGGKRSKFGLDARELMRAVEILHKRDKAECLKLVHFHVGSQICDIRTLSGAVDELTRTYCELRAMGCGVEMIDIGGGLGVDYDGTRSPTTASTNYSLKEYALDVIHRIRGVCDEEGEPHPTVLAECGRAMVAYSSVLVVDVMGRAASASETPDETIDALLEAGGEQPRPLTDLVEAFEASKNSTRTEQAVSLWHDALRAQDECNSLYSLGYLTLRHKAAADSMASRVGAAALRTARSTGDGELPDELVALPDQMADSYFVNMSIFQSLPDFWAIDQVFPICPIHRLDERPTRPGVLCDMSCDSDGKVDKFVWSEASTTEKTLMLHEPVPEDPARPGGPSADLPYCLGIFLVGAYQEVLGDLHNLFGDTHAVHIRLDRSGSNGNWVVEEVVEGDSAREVLQFVQYDVEQLRRDVRTDVERATAQARITPQEGRRYLEFFTAGLEGYTYLE